MSYIGNPIVSTDFPVDTFSGNGSTTAFTLTQAPASVNAIIVAVSGVLQEPSTYTISGTTLTFTAAPPSGTSNISVRHLGVAGIPNTPVAGSVQYSSLNSSLQGTLVGRNRIINGAMVIDQRNAGASVTGNNGIYTLDRWYLNLDQNGKFNVQQNAGSVTPPIGFSNYLGITSTSAYTVGTNEAFVLDQKIEGYNMADLNWGSANAKTVTLSFWVYSSLIGLFSGNIQNSGRGRTYVFSYTINAANTWEQKTITIAGDTSGSWLTTNGIGMYIGFSLGTGSGKNTTAGSWGSTIYFGATSSINVVGTNGATFYITGVQLEVGSTATSFDYRPYGTELALCQRYFEKSYDTTVAPATNTTTNAVYNYGSTDQYSSLVASVPFRVEKRAAPTMTAYQTGGTSGSWAYGRSGATGTATANFYDTGTTRFTQYMTIGASAYASANCIGHWTASAEL